MFQKIGQRGFTLIELLVVIAIIGILAATVLASLGNARKSGDDAKIKQQLASMRSQAELYYTTNSSYAVAAGTNDVCTDGASLLAGLTGVNCDASASAWAAEAQLSTSNFWCSDSTGASHAIAASKGVATVACPAS